MLINWWELLKAERTQTPFYNGGWVKQVTDVDLTQKAGYAFSGDFVSNARDNGLTECPDGYYIVCTIEGSRKSQDKYVAVYHVDGDQVTKALDWVKGDDWALQIRGQVVELLEIVPNPLAVFSNEELAAELRSRGFRVDRSIEDKMAAARREKTGER